MNKKFVVVLVVLAFLLALAAIEIATNEIDVGGNGPCDPGWAHLPGGPPGWLRPPTRESGLLF